MRIQQLIAKKAYYEAKKVELSIDNHEEEIKSSVAEFRRQKELEIENFEKSEREKHEAQTQKDIEKVDNYLELISELLSEAQSEENSQTIENNT